jgi:hypothetical protein
MSANIDRTTVNGRPASVAYIHADYTPATKDDWDLANVMFDDGGSVTLTNQTSPKDAAIRGAAEGAAFTRHRMKHKKPYGVEKLPGPPKGIGGVSYARLAARLSRQDLSRIKNMIRTGLLAGKDGPTIARMVIGSMGVNGVDGVTEFTRKQLVRLAHQAAGTKRARKKG